MRVIAGTRRRRKLLGPKDDSVSRPITDRVKQSLFDRLYMAGMLDGGNALDIFSGVGSLGIEALSRGLDHCTFIERHAGIRAILEENLSILELSNQATLLRVDALGTNWIPLLSHTPILIAFCDPPYPMVEEPEGLQRVLNLVQSLLPVIEPGGAVMLRTPQRIKVPPLEGWREPSSYDYGSMTLHFYQKPKGEEPEELEEADPESSGDASSE